MYEQFLKFGLIRIAVLFCFAGIIFYVSYINTESVITSIFILALSIFIWNLFLGQGLNPRRKLVDRIIENGFSRTQDMPLVDEDADSPSSSSAPTKKWEKGIGYTDDIDQPMWVAADQLGIALYYMCYASKNPFLIPWNRMSQMSVSRDFTQSTDIALARLFIPGVGMEVVVPWHQRFNKFVPDKLAFNE